MPEEGVHSLAEALDSIIGSIRREFEADWLLVLSGAEDAERAGESIPPTGALCESLEAHTFIELCICLQGSFQMGAGDTDHDMKAGMMCLLLPGAAHVEIPSRDYTAVWIAVNHGRAGIHLSGRQYPLPFAIRDMFIFKPGIECLHTIDELLSEASGRDSYYMDVMKAGIIRLIAACRRELAIDRKSESGQSGWRDAVTNETQRYIKKNLGCHLRLSDIAQAMCISSNHLNMIFKAQTGKTIIQYHEECRLNAARELISQTKTNINEISASLGYYDQYHFSKAFKKAFGLSPSAYRSQRSY
jgi:AraC-like DNA-binding protein